MKKASGAIRASDRAIRARSGSATSAANSGGSAEHVERCASSAIATIASPSAPMRRARASRRSSAGGEAAAEPGEHQKAREHHGDRVERVGEEQREALDRGDLDEQEGKADRAEIEARCASGRRGDCVSATEPERQQHQDERSAAPPAPASRSGSDSPSRAARRPTAPQASTAPAAPRHLKKSKKYGRSSVAGREVELVAREEPVAVRSDQRLRRLEEIRLLQQIVAIGFFRAHARVVGEIERALVGERADPRDVLGRRAAPFLTRSVVVSQLRIRASWRAGLGDAPALERPQRRQRTASHCRAAAASASG